MKAEKIRIDDVRMDSCTFHAKTLVHLERAVLHELGRKQGRIRNRYDLVIIAVHDEDGHVDLLQVVGAEFASLWRSECGRCAQAARSFQIGGIGEVVAGHLGDYPSSLAD